jgi:hypothetical protein
MTDWKLTVDIVEDLKLYNNNYYTSQEFCHSVLWKLVELKNLVQYYPQYVKEFEEITEIFEHYSELDELDEDDVNDLLDKLYDWGDISVNNIPNQKLCWIKTL